MGNHNLQHLVDHYTLNRKMLGDTESQMFKHGYRNMTEHDVTVYYYIGERVFDQLAEATMRYSCLEAEFLQIEKKGDAFTQLCKLNRVNIMRSVIEQLPYMAGHSFNFLAVSDYEMAVQIRKKYKGKHPNIIFSMKAK